MRTKDTEALYVEIPPSLKHLVDTDERSNKEIVISALERELGVPDGYSIGIIEHKIRKTEERLRDRQDDLDATASEVSEIKESLEELRSFRDQHEEEQGSYIDALDEIIDEMLDGEIQHLVPYIPRLNEVRAEFDRPAEEICIDVKERAAELDVDLNNTHFMEHARARQTRRNGDEVAISDAIGDNERESR